MQRRLPRGMVQLPSVRSPCLPLAHEARVDVLVLCDVRRLRGLLFLSSLWRRWIVWRDGPNVGLIVACMAALPLFGCTDRLMELVGPLRDGPSCVAAYFALVDSCCACCAAVAHFHVINIIIVVEQLEVCLG